MWHYLREVCKTVTPIFRHSATRHLCFWDTAVCHWVTGHRHFKMAWCSHIQGSKYNEEFFIGPVTQKCSTINQKNTGLNWITAKTLNLTCCTTFWFLDTWFTCTRATQTHIGNLQLKFCILDCHYCMQVINFLFQSSLPIKKYPWHPILEESESCKIWVSYSNVDEDRSRMGRYAMSTGKWFTPLKELPTS